MNYFTYRENQLFAENVSVQSIIEKYGSPCYIYSRATLEKHWHAFNDAFGKHAHLICYAVKANSNLGVLNVLARLGSGFDIVSIGELQRVYKQVAMRKKLFFQVLANALMKFGML